MSKVKPTTKEQLIHYLIHNISLGNYDNRFLTNVENNFIGANKPVTSNQSSLLNKIIHRYARQLAKQELNATELVQLPWKKEPILSAIEYTTAYAQIDDNKIIIRTPYKSSFIKEIRRIDTADWIKEDREWTVNYNELSLKNIVTLIADHYEVIDFCDEIKHSLSIAEQFEQIKVWNPTLCEVSGNLIIAGINEPLYNAIVDIQLEKTPLCFSKLAAHGVEISSSLCTDGILEFAANATPNIEKDKVSSLVDLLPMIGCETVIVPVTHSFANLTLDLLSGLKEKNIKILNRSNIDVEPTENYVVIYPVHPSNTALDIRADKVIHIVNSTPIEIK